MKHRKLKVHFEADTVDELIAQFFSAAKFVAENRNNITEDPEEECEENEECKECYQLKDTLEDLQKAIATLTYYDLPIPPELAEKYNDVREEFLNYPCPHEDDEEEDEDN